MKFITFAYIIICMISSIRSQCPNRVSYISSFSTSSFAGTWFVYQRSYTADTEDYNRNGLCDHIDSAIDSTGYYLITNYTVFSLKDQTFKSNVSNYYYEDTTYPGVLIQFINPNGTTDTDTLRGDPVYNVVDTDYTSYALVWYCQTLYYNSYYKQYLMLLLRNLNNIESTVLPKIYDIFQKIKNLNGYDGNQFELVYHDNGFCRGL